MRIIDADLLECDTEWDDYEDGFTAYSRPQIECAPTIKAKQVKYYDEDENVWKVGNVIIEDELQTERRTDRDGDVWEWRGDAWHCIGQPIERKTEPQTEPLPKAINGVKIADAVAWADKWLEDNPVSEMWDMIRTLRDATEWQDEPQTDCTNCDQLGRCDRGRAVECPLTNQQTERSE